MTALREKNDSFSLDFGLNSYIEIGFWKVVSGNLLIVVMWKNTFAISILLFLQCSVTCE